MSIKFQKTTTKINQKLEDEILRSSFQGKVSIWVFYSPIEFYSLILE